jgi:plastocyanin domain-containing protein
VKQGIPVKLNFRQMGQVGCGSTMIFPADPQNKVALSLKSPEDLKVLEFTPSIAGNFDFECSSNCYRGIMTVRENGQS